MTAPLPRVDGSTCSAVYVCRCGARDVATTRPIVLRAAAHHLDVAHNDHAGAAILRARAELATRRLPQKSEIPT